VVPKSFGIEQSRPKQSFRHQPAREQFVDGNDIERWQGDRSVVKFGGNSVER
jgi:hypothetical protein